MSVRTVCWVDVRERHILYKRSHPARPTRRKKKKENVYIYNVCTDYVTLMAYFLREMHVFTTAVKWNSMFLWINC